MYNHHRISRKPADSYSDSYTGRTPKDLSPIPDSEFKIYEHEDTPPSKNNTINMIGMQKKVSVVWDHAQIQLLYTLPRRAIWTTLTWQVFVNAQDVV